MVDEVVVLLGVREVPVRLAQPLARVAQLGVGAALKAGREQGLGVLQPGTKARERSEFFFSVNSIASIEGYDIVTKEESCVWPARKRAISSI